MISEKLSTDSRRMLQNGVPQFVGFCRCTPCRQRRGKAAISINGLAGDRCTPCRQRRGKVVDALKKAGWLGCTPCRQRRGKAFDIYHMVTLFADAPRAGSAEAKTPLPHHAARAMQMHPVQAAPRQSDGCGSTNGSRRMHPVQAAPRQRIYVR